MGKFLGSIFILLFVLSCNDHTELIEMKSINGMWNKKTVQNFNFEIKDAQIPKNIIFVVRNNNDYPYSNLRLIVNFINLKTKEKETDTLNYILAKPNGDWLGRGFGETKEILFQYKTHYTFPENGKYSIGIIQAMRKDHLPGIEDIGISIKEVSKTKEDNGK